MMILNVLLLRRWWIEFRPRSRYRKDRISADGYIGAEILSDPTQFYPHGLYISIICHKIRVGYIWSNRLTEVTLNIVESQEITTPLAMSILITTKPSFCSQDKFLNIKSLVTSNSSQTCAELYIEITRHDLQLWILLFTIVPYSYIQYSGSPRKWLL